MASANQGCYRKLIRKYENIENEYKITKKNFSVDYLDVDYCISILDDCSFLYENCISCINEIENLQNTQDFKTKKTEKEYGERLSELKNTKSEIKDFVFELDNKISSSISSFSNDEIKDINEKLRTFY